MENEDIMQGVPSQKNGVCSAHPLLLNELQGINNKLDALTTDDIKQKAINEYWEPWKQRFIGACFVLIPMIAFEMIKYFTPL